MVPLHAAIQKSIIATINQPQFDASLPPLSDETWAKLLAPPKLSYAENERLEFLGDALMYATIGRMLYAQIPNGSPHLYTNVRAALHSNATFSHLAEKLDILAVSSSVLKALTIRKFGEGISTPMQKTKPQVKATADLFETVIGAYYLERGFEALCTWVKEIYKPLITAAQKTFNECQATRKNKNKRPRHSGDSHLLSASSPKRAKLLHSPPVRKVVPFSSRTRASRPGEVSLRAVHQLVKAGNSSSTSPRAKSMRASPARKSRMPINAYMSTSKAHTKAVFIDLTLTCDSSDDEESPVTQAYHIRANHGNKASSSVTQVVSANQGFHVLATSGDDEDDDDEESILEQMLTTGVPGSDIDMDPDCE